MGGARQFTSLLRKNVLLKTRRPWATACEMTMPLVLFTLLVWVRNKVEDKNYGPFVFSHNEIFPMSNTVVRGLMSTFDVEVDGSTMGGSNQMMGASNQMMDEFGNMVASNKSMKEKDSGSDAELKKMMKELMGDSLCDNEGMSKMVGDMLQPIMSMQVDGKTVAHRMLWANATTEAKWARDAVEEAQDWNISKWTKDIEEERRKYFASDWPKMIEDAAKDVDADLKKLKEDLTSPTGAARTRKIVEYYVDNACSYHLPGDKDHSKWNALDITKLAKDLNSLRETLENSGVASWFKNATDKNQSKFWQPMRTFVNDINTNDTVMMFRSFAEIAQGTSAESIAVLLDDGAWWLSHFLRTRSATAKFLGEMPGHKGIGILDADDSDWKAEELTPEVWPEELNFRTAMAGRIFQDMEEWQKDADPKKMSEDFRKEWEKIKKRVNSMEDDYSGPRRCPLRDIIEYNMTGYEHTILPKWNASWPTECPKRLNKKRIADEVEKMRKGCPFYKKQVRKLASYNLTEEIVKMHNDLRKWKVTDTMNTVRAMQNTFTKEVDAKSVESMVKNVLSVAQVDKMIPGMGSWQGEVAKNVMAAKNASSSSKMVSEYSKGMGGVLMNEMKEWMNMKPSDCKASKDRRLQRKKVSRYDSIIEEIMTRKILIAPYKGEAKELVNFMMVELALSVATNNENSREEQLPEALQSLLRCPVVRAAIAIGADMFLKERLLTFDDEKSLEVYARDNPKEVVLAIVFRNADPATGNFPKGLTVDYSIRAHAQYLPQTSKVLRMARNAMYGAVRNTFYPYIDLYFAHLQEIIGRATARLRATRNTEVAGNRSSLVGSHIAATVRTEEGRDMALALQQFPAPAYKVDRFIRVIQHTMPMMFILGWIYAVSLLVKEMVYEKQEKLRDVMRIQGLKTWVYWSSWVASAMIQMTFLVSIMTFILCGGEVLKHSDWTLVFVFFWTYSLATVSFSMFISSFFSSAKVAAACAGLIYYVAYLPYSMFNRFEDIMSIHAKNALCLLSSSAMGIGSGLIAKWELIEEGAQWSNFGSPPPVTNSGAKPKDDFSLANVMLMLLVDTVVYGVLAWYIEKIKPGTLGLPQPWYFPVQPAYWRGARDEKDEVCDNELEDIERTGNTKIECWEAGPALDAVVKIRNLTKTFAGGKRALKGISLDMHKGTILGLLGHNGAGKTTTMAILTGLYPPTAGDVNVNGTSVKKDSHGVRKQLGVCLQQNALYELISVEEHLALFCCLKSVPWNEMKSTVQSLLQDTGLLAKRHAPSKALSGGMKRKLSIGIALAGGSQVVTLDEPTAGVDATSRRDIWHLLAAQKTKRTILLSTHFMDEADILSDRIAIIAEGEITAIGASMTLKKHYADSYMLTIVAVDEADPQRLSRAILEAVPEARAAGRRGREISYSLPGSCRGRFPSLFRLLQDVGWRAMHGIDTYGLSAASMEEVFLQASSMHEEGLTGKIRNVDSLQIDNVQAPPQLEAAMAVMVGDGPPSDQVSTTSGTDSREGSKSISSGSDGKGAQVPQERNGMDREITPERQWDSTSGEAPVEMGPVSPQSMVSPSAPEPAAIAVAEAEAKDTKMKEKVTASDAQMVERQSPRGEIFKSSRQLRAGPVLWKQQFLALVRKRALSVRRDRKAWASQLLLPAIFVLFALIVAAILSVKEEEPPLKLTSDMFIGMNAAGSVQSSMDQHNMPWCDLRKDEFSKDMYSAFSKAKGEGDVLPKIAMGSAPGEYSTLSEYMMSNNQALSLTTYGGVEIGGSKALANATLFFRARAYHAVPVFTNIFNNARFKRLGFDDTEVITWTHPLPKSQVALEAEMTGGSQVMVDLTVAITVLLAMGFIPASFVVYLVHEKATSGKHQQLLTGVSPTMYWISSYIWDMMNYMVPLIVCYLIFVCFQVEAYSGRNSPAIFFLLLFYGICMTPCMYCLEPFFSVPSTAYVTLICMNIFSGTISVMATAVLDMVQQDEPSLKPINAFCKAVFPWLLPNYSLGRGMIDIAANHYMNFASDEFGICIFPDGSCIRDPMHWDVAGKHVACLAAMVPFWCSLRMLMEWGCCTRRLKKSMAMHNGVKSEKSPDEAVNKEAERIAAEMAAGSSQDNLLISNLAKSFRSTRAGCCKRAAPAVHAVRGVNVGVPKGECFGLLGVNGAGKTTTMKMITGDTEIGGGDIQVCGASVQNQRDKARWHLGYCPQFDALPDKLTCRETLALYARIRGVPAANVATTVDTMIKRMCLEAHQSNTCEHLSGGNKRKLSTALSLIGEPDVVLLDEPSTGVDVGARRFLWDVIGEIRQSGHAVILTSHSMEECEVLCTRLTIMVHGGLRCLGSPMQLKARYGGGYTLMVKARLSTENADSCQRIRDFVAANVPGALLTEESVGLFRYGLGGRGSDKGADSEVPLATIFETFETASKEGGELHGCVSDYTLSQTSLEEVFLHFSQEAASQAIAEATDSSPAIEDTSAAIAVEDVA